MKETFVVVGGLVIQIAVGFAPLFLWKMALVSRSALGRLAGNINNSTKGLTNRAKEKAEGSNYYQRRQFASEARKQERRRSNVEDYATRVSGEGWRARALRRRAAGGLSGQVLGAISGDRLGANIAGQQRIGQAAEDQLRKQRHEESQRALQRMNNMGIEGDDDLLAIARSAPGAVFAQERDGRATGITMRVNEAERQAAINSLVQQGRVSPLRQLENIGPARGPGGTPNPENALHNMLDEAYTSVPNKLGDKAPDLLPNRRATQGIAAFTDLQPDDVAGWHHSTVRAAGEWYGATTDAAGNPLSAAQITQRQTERDRMLRAFSLATQNTTTRSKLSLDQVTRARAVLNEAMAAGQTIDPGVQNNINNMYTTLGGP